MSAILPNQPKGPNTHSLGVFAILVEGKGLDIQQTEQFIPGSETTQWSISYTSHNTQSVVATKWRPVLSQWSCESPIHTALIKWRQSRETNKPNTNHQLPGQNFLDIQNFFFLANCKIKAVTIFLSSFQLPTGHLPPTAPCQISHYSSFPWPFGYLGPVSLTKTSKYMRNSYLRANMQDTSLYCLSETSLCLFSI